MAGHIREMNQRIQALEEKLFEHTRQLSELQSKMNRRLTTAKTKESAQ